MFVSCVYEGRRLFPNHVLWETGRACQCDAYAASSCSNSLCVTGKPVGPKTTTTTTTTTTTRRPAVVKPPAKEPASTTCAANKGMTDELRQIFLTKHNYYRSYVAKGQAKDKLITKGNAPKAARMRKMVYDCRVEASAMRHAKKCKYGHSDGSERPDLGESVWAISYNRMDKAQSAEMSCDDWFGELAKNGVGRENVLTKKLFYRPNKQIFQMVWQNTYKLGCAVEWCPTMTFVVCQYNPPGNYLGQLIYEVGEPCRNDGDCRCPKCRCSRNEALCIVA
ncbi:SCP-like protein [Ostertagia ostertagi]